MGTSLFHSGEIELQSRVGSDVREQVEAFSQRAIRPFMPEQHRTFFAQLPFMVVGVVDAQGRPWASLLSGLPGFVQTPTDRQIQMTTPMPVAAPLQEGLKSGAPIGMLGIELGTRRRNRANGMIAEAGPESLQIEIQQSFGNCPKYIQTRTVSWREGTTEPRYEALETLTEEALRLISGSDMFFVATYVDDLDAADERRRMVDVSHRGGKPGFVRLLADGRLEVPDFVGNYMFCTLGNMLRNPVAGLVFPDFESGDLLHISGETELLWDGPEATQYTGAVRAWRIRPHQAFWLRKALPFSASGPDYSPFLEKLGPWS